MGRFKEGGRVMIWYAIGGLLMNWFHDMTVDKLETEELRFDWKERVLVFVFWPFYLLVMIVNFLRNI